MLSLKNVKGEKMKKGKLIATLFVIVLSIIAMPICSYAIDINIYNGGTIHTKESKINLYLDMSLYQREFCLIFLSHLRLLL